MISDNRSMKRYFRRIRGTLPCSRKLKNHIMDQIHNEVGLYLEEHPGADYNAVLSRFGEPERIAAAYVEDMGAAEILKKLRIRRRILSTVALVLAFTLITWAAIITYEIIQHKYCSNDRYIVVETE